MHDLRRQALLESGKTVSRKARSRIASTTTSKAGSKINSPAQSRAVSRNPSRAGSDDEEYLSDGTAWSTNSIDELLNDEDGSLAADAWKAELQTRIEQIIDHKRSSTEGRTESLNVYAHILMARYANNEVESRTRELLPALLRSIKSETTERESVAALQALMATVVTVDSDDIYDSASDLLRRTISDSGNVPIKVAAIHALVTSAFFCGTSEEEMQDLMLFLQEIIESDGLSVDAHDEGAVVIAALEEWGLLASMVDDLEEITEGAIEAFVDQLQSSDAGVQIAAGENIALMYEKSYTPIEDDEQLSGEEDESDDDVPNDNVKLVRRYTVYRRQDQLLQTLDELANISTRRISKKDRKTLHSSFADIRNSVEKPTRGPKYSTALDQEGRLYGGGRMKVILVNRNYEVRIDKWWKLHVLNALRRVLQGGFTHHYDVNEAVSRLLPFSMVQRKVR